MKLNQILQFVLVFTVFTTLFSCKSEDEKYPRIVNIKFDMVPVGSASPEGYIIRTINNDETSDYISGFPYSKAVTQVTAEVGTYVKLTYDDETVCQSGQNCSFFADLSISVDDVIVKSENFRVSEGTGVLILDYTFE